MSRTMKILTAVLKYIVDATAMGLISFSQVKCLKFSLDYVEFIMSNLKQQSSDKLQFKEEDFKDAFLCLKSSFTYFAKLLNLVLVSSNGDSLPPPEAHNLANGLLDLIVSIESFLGSSYATRVVAAMKPWLPDLILALGSAHIQKQTVVDRESESSCFPLWLTMLAKTEFREISEVGSDEESEKVSELLEFPAFKKLTEMVILFLSGNANVLDAVGVVFLSGIAAGLERKDFEMVLGLAHFVYVKLFKQECGEWEELKLMSAFVHGIYPRLEREAELSNNEDERKMLQSAMVLLEPVQRSNMDGFWKDQMEEE